MYCISTRVVDLGTLRKGETEGEGGHINRIATPSTSRNVHSLRDRGCVPGQGGEYYHGGWLVCQVSMHHILVSMELSKCINTSQHDQTSDGTPGAGLRIPVHTYMRGATYICTYPYTSLRARRGQNR
jgi:hypothetical protein